MNIFEKEIQEQKDKELARSRKRFEFDSQVMFYVGVDVPKTYTVLTSVPGYHIDNNHPVGLDDKWNVYKVPKGLISFNKIRITGEDEEEAEIFLRALRTVVGQPPDWKYTPPNNEKSPE